MNTLVITKYLVWLNTDRLWDCYALEMVFNFKTQLELVTSCVANNNLRGEGYFGTVWNNIVALYARYEMRRENNYNK